MRLDARRGGIGLHTVLDNVAESGAKYVLTELFVDDLFAALTHLGQDTSVLIDYMFDRTDRRIDVAVLNVPAQIILIHQIRSMTRIRAKKQDRTT